MSSSRFLRAALALPLLVGIAACGGDDGGDSAAGAGGGSTTIAPGGTETTAAGAGGTTTTAAELDDTIPEGTVLRIGDQLGGMEVPLRISGELDDLPYEIQWSTYASGPLVNEAIAAGEIDLGPMGDTPAILSVASGLDTVVVAVRESTGLGATLFANPDRGIESLEDLAGHSIAYTTGTSAHGFVLRALDSVGLSEADITQVDVPITDVATVVANGDADAGSVYEVFRPAFTQAQPNAVPLVSVTDLSPNYTFLLSPRSSATDPAIGAAIEDFVARLARAGQWVQDNVDEFIQAYYVDELRQEPENARAAFEAQGESSWIEPSDDVRAVQQEQADLLFENNRLPEEVDLTAQFDPAVTSRFIDAIQEALQ